jgi:hypothetical protein
MATMMLVRLPKIWRWLGLLLVLCLAVGCGGSSTAPTLGVTVATGPQVLRLTYTSLECRTNGVSIFPMVYTRVTVSKAGNEWSVVPATPEAGDFEMRFHQTGTAVIAGSVPIEGAIRGQAIHLPELLASVPPSSSRMAFGNDGRTTITGYAFGPSSLTPTAGVGGIGTGTVTLSDDTGRSCGGTSFSWGMAPQ